MQSPTIMDNNLDEENSTWLPNAILNMHIHQFVIFCKKKYVSGVFWYNIEKNVKLLENWLQFEIPWWTFVGVMQRITFRSIISLCVYLCLCVCRVCGLQENGLR